ncbi:MAG: hypothetical protein JRJ39_00510 [Deltaproteobacteria bacterium]|nr:hypothetical protein [Deltaproteobacteria bacterium]MBW1845591.1 hypothetical protein [Deltaproteobacteria bacterium]MBW2032019.1 hypothetical protein [Deltaproteobacteria bacterium]
MSVGLNNYDFNEKEKWRVWTWNRIREKTHKPIKDSLGLYFAAAQDLDRPVAIKKGFSDHNLLAVERDLKSVKILRKNGVNVIHSDLTSVINDWKGRNEIDFINADFTCGITDDIIAFLYMAYLCHSVSSGCIVAINLLRGRDIGLREIAETVGRKDTLGSYVLKKSLSKKKQRGKHRGQRIFICGLLWVYINLADSARVFGKNKGSKYSKGENRASIDHLIRFIKKAGPSFYSYKSSNGRNVMDACVFEVNKNFFQKVNNHSDSKTFIPRVFKKLDININPKSARMKVAAAKAVRTMRKGAT